MHSENLHHLTKVVNQAVDILVRIGERMPWSFVGGVTFTVYSFLFGIDHNIALVSLLVLIILDFTSAIAAAYVSGEEIKSAKALRSAVKVVVYFGLIAGAHIAENGLSIFASIIDESTIGFLVATELISLMENAGKMGFRTPNVLLNKLKDFTNKK